MTIQAKGLNTKVVLGVVLRKNWREIKMEINYELRFKGQPADINVFEVARSWPLQDTEFWERIQRLRSASVQHTMDGNQLNGGPFLRNGGIAGATYDWGRLPRAVVKDSIGELELLVDAYRCGDALMSDGTGRFGPPAVITLYSSEPVRAKAFLSGIGYK